MSGVRGEPTTPMESDRVGAESLTGNSGPEANHGNLDTSSSTPQRIRDPTLNLPGGQEWNAGEKQQAPIVPSSVEDSEKESSNVPDHKGAEQDEPIEEWVGGLELATILAGITLVCFLMLLDTSIISTAIPRITTDFHSLPDVGCAALQPLTGKFYSSFSSKMLILGRAIAGMGTSGIENGAFTIIAGCVPMAKRPDHCLSNTICLVSQLGLVIGPLIGGALTQYSTWRWCFYVNLPVGGLVAALLFFVHIPERITKPPALSVLRTLHSELDLVGFVLFAPAAIQLLLALQYGGNEFAWNNSCLVFGFLMSLLYCATYYLPIYFQAVKGVSPMLSGVYLLPSILSQLIAAVISGVLVEKLGYYPPYILVGSVVNAVADGLLSTFKPDTSTGKWIGYKILSGFGQGVGLQMPIVAVQNTLPPPLIPVAMALVMFSSTFGGSLFLSFSQTILTNSLRSLIAQYAPAVNAETVIAAGATGVQAAVPANDLPGVLVAYSHSTDRVFYLCAGAAVACFIFSWGMGWKDIRTKKQVSQA
ncbi:putative MFS multidrug transporter [Thermoascus aurantiacus ATCC 26904]